MSDVFTSGECKFKIYKKCVCDILRTVREAHPSYKIRATLVAETYRMQADTCFRFGSKTDIKQNYLGATLVAETYRMQADTCFRFGSKTDIKQNYLERFRVVRLPIFTALCIYSVSGTVCHKYLARVTRWLYLA